MSALIHYRRLVAVLCIALVIAAAVVPPASGLLSAILTPLWLLFAVVITISICPLAENYRPRQLLLVPSLASRAPPIA